MNKGFTLVELLVTITLVVILLAIATPSFQELIGSNRLAAQVNDFIGTMNLARAEASKRGIQVSVCASDPNAPGNASQTLCAGAWTGGWIVFTDEDGDYTIDVGIDEKLRARGPLTGSTLSAVRDPNVNPTAITRVGYSSRGNSVDDEDIEFELCAPNIKKSRILELNPVGRLHKQGAVC